MTITFHRLNTFLHSLSLHHLYQQKGIKGKALQHLLKKLHASLFSQDYHCPIENHVFLYLQEKYYISTYKCQGGLKYVYYKTIRMKQG